MAFTRILWQFPLLFNNPPVTSCTVRLAGLVITDWVFFATEIVTVGKAQIEKKENISSHWGPVHTNRWINLKTPVSQRKQMKCPVLIHLIALESFSLTALIRIDSAKTAKTFFFVTQIQRINVKTTVPILVRTENTCFGGTWRFQKVPLLRTRKQPAFNDFFLYGEGFWNWSILCLFSF